MKPILNPEKIALDLYLKSGLIPIDIKQICKALGVDILYEDLGKLDGFLYADCEGAVILTNKRQHQYRQRFSIAHELGHLACGHRGRLSDEDEREANAVAANLLMPAPMIAYFWKNYAGEPENWRTQLMAHTFAVSLTAMIIRLKSLGYLRAAKDYTSPPVVA